jgi:hypothetical protein
MTSKQIAEIVGMSVKEIEEVLKKDLPLPEITSRKQAISIYESAMAGSQIEIFALNKWNEFSTKEVEDANDLSQALEAFYGAFTGSKPERLAFEKSLSFCTTVPQVLDLHNEAANITELLILFIRKLSEMPYPEEEE